MKSVKIAEGSVWVRKNDMRLAYMASQSIANVENKGGPVVKFYYLYDSPQGKALGVQWLRTCKFLKLYSEVSIDDAIKLKAASIAQDVEPSTLNGTNPSSIVIDELKAIEEAETMPDDAYPDIIPTSLYGELVPKEGEVYIYHALNPRRIGERARIMRVELCDTALGSADRQAGRTLTYQVYYLVNTEIDLGVQCCSKESFRQSYRLHAPHSMVDAFTHERIADE